MSQNDKSTNLYNRLSALFSRPQATSESGFLSVDPLPSRSDSPTGELGSSSPPSSPRSSVTDATASESESPPLSPRGTPRNSGGEPDDVVSDGGEVRSQPLGSVLKLGGLTSPPISSEIKKRYSDGKSERGAGFFSASQGRKVGSPEKTSHGSLMQLPNERERARAENKNALAYKKVSPFKDVIEGLRDEIKEAKNKPAILSRIISELRSTAQNIAMLQKRAITIEGLIIRGKSPEFKPQEFKAIPLGVSGSNLNIWVERLDELSKKIKALNKDALAHKKLDLSNNITQLGDEIREAMKRLADNSKFLPHIRSELRSAAQNIATLEKRTVTIEGFIIREKPPEFKPQELGDIPLVVSDNNVEIWAGRLGELDDKIKALEEAVNRFANYIAKKGKDSNVLETRHSSPSL